ncbi:outer membrane protein assembly factor BamB [Facilibium subflavum]|uniref:outer membrane protein assembly factor BamB n=1 Tax=Facilibium subflavum TaxID=2219058 RepID=UPI0013C3234F|nr:outer membrane protein assembly factor BamB [Facilibium subflavum]
MKKRLIQLLLTGLFAVLLSACANKSNDIPPKDLIKFTPKLHASYVWGRDIGNGTGKQLDVKLAPAIQNDTIYTVSFDGYVSAVNAQNGKIRWYKNTHLQLTASPNISDNFIITGSLHGKLIALDTTSGKILWQSTLPSSLFSKPAIHDGVIYVQTHDGSISAYQLKDGKQLWTQKSPTPDLMLIGNSSPIYYKGLVLAGTASGSLWGFKADNGQKQWDNPVALPSGGSPAAQMVDINATPIIDNNVLYIATFQGNLISFDTQYGNVKWQKKASVFNNMSLTDNALFVSDAKSDLIAYDTKNGQIKWQKDILQGRKISAPLYYKGYVIVGDYEGYLHIFNATTGQYLDRVDIGGDGIKAQPVIANSYIAVQTNDGTLAAVKL